MFREPDEVSSEVFFAETVVDRGPKVIEAVLEVAFFGAKVFATVFDTVVAMVVFSEGFFPT